MKRGLTKIRVQIEKTSASLCGEHNQKREYGGLSNSNCECCEKKRRNGYGDEGQRVYKTDREKAVTHGGRKTG